MSSLLVVRVLWVLLCGRQFVRDVPWAWAWAFGWWFFSLVGIGLAVSVLLGGERYADLLTTWTVVVGGALLVAAVAAYWPSWRRWRRVWRRATGRYY